MEMNSLQNYRFLISTFVYLETINVLFNYVISNTTNNNSSKFKIIKAVNKQNIEEDDFDDDFEDDFDELDENEDFDFNDELNEDEDFDFDECFFELTDEDVLTDDFTTDFDDDFEDDD